MDDASSIKKAYPMGLEFIDAVQLEGFIEPDFKNKKAEEYRTRRASKLAKPRAQQQVQSEPTKSKQQSGKQASGKAKSKSPKPTKVGQWSLDQGARRESTAVDKQSMRTLSRRSNEEPGFAFTIPKGIPRATPSKPKRLSKP